jgi:hypothetical protein
MRMMMMTTISCYYYRYPKLISQIPNWVVLLFFLLFISPQNTPTPTQKKVSPAETNPPSGNAKPIKIVHNSAKPKNYSEPQGVVNPTTYFAPIASPNHPQNKQTKTRRLSENQISLQCHKQLEKSQEIGYNSSTCAWTSSILQKKPIENPPD